MPARDVTERPQVSDLDQDRAIWMVPERHPCLEQHVRPGLTAWGDLIVTFRQLGSKVRNLIRREQHDDGVGSLECRVEDLTDVGRANTGLDGDIQVSVGAPPER